MRKYLNSAENRQWCVIEDTGYLSVCPWCSARYDESIDSIGKQRDITFIVCPTCAGAKVKKSDVKRRTPIP